MDPNHTYKYEEGQVSLKWNRKHDRPKGALGSLYRSFPDPLKRIRVISAVAQSIVFDEPTDKQLTKFTDGALREYRCKNDLFIEDVDLLKLEDRLLSNLANQEPYSPMDLTGSFLPYAEKSSDIRDHKKILHAAANGDISRTSEDAHSSVLTLHGHFLGQRLTAPMACKKFRNEFIQLASTLLMLREIREGRCAMNMKSLAPLEYPYMMIPEAKAICKSDIKEYNNKPLAHSNLEDFYEEELRETVRDTYCCNGRLDFLQQRNGKLRPVANVNRYTNYCMEPFAKALEDVFYVKEQIFVQDQKAGLRWAQQQLRLGHRLTSMDMSAATDTLDFRALLRGLSRLSTTNAVALNCKYFEKISTLPLWSESFDSAFQFNTGQPLGMKGSFQVLTVMNYLAGVEACRRTGHPVNSFAVVGDDFVCHTEIAEEYAKIITDLGSSINMEKTMTSDKYAEFLSHIVTEHDVYTTKPKYRLSTNALFINAEKAKKSSILGLWKISDRDLDCLNTLQKYSTSEMDDRTALPHLRSKDLAIDNSTLDTYNLSLKICRELIQDTPRKLEVTLNKNIVSYLSQEMPHIRKSIPSVYEHTDEDMEYVESDVDCPYETHWFSEPAVDNEPILDHEIIVEFPLNQTRFDHKSNEVAKVEDLKQQYDKAHVLSETLTKIDEVYTSETRHTITDNYGRSYDADDIVANAMVETEQLREANRKDHCTLTDKQTHIPDAEKISETIQPTVKSQTKKSVVDYILEYTAGCEAETDEEHDEYN